MVRRLNGSRGIIVLGMHRSGTSALAGALRLLGVELGSNLFLPESGVNDKGFWEHADIVRTHDRLLEALDSRWDDLFPLPENWWISEAAAPFSEELRQILHGDFGDTPLWSVKDPRMCRLLPLWLRLLEQVGADPLFILMVRDPAEVVRSLETRDGFQAERSRVLWLEHICEAVKWSRGYPRTLITYDQLLTDWRTVLARIASDLSVVWPRDMESVSDAIGRFIEPGLRHHRIEPLQHREEDHPGWLAAAYEAVVSPDALKDGPSQETLLSLGRVLEGAGAIYGPWVGWVNRHMEDISGGFGRAMEIISEKDGELSQKDGLVKDLGAGLSEALNQLEIVRTALSGNIAELERVRSELDLKAGELELMRRSRMWRLGQWMRRSLPGRLISRAAEWRRR